MSPIARKIALPKLYKDITGIPKKYTLKYKVACPKTSSGVCIIISNGFAKTTPIIVKINPPIMLVATAV